MQSMTSELRIQTCIMVSFWYAILCILTCTCCRHWMMALLYQRCYFCGLGLFETFDRRAVAPDMHHSLFLMQHYVLITSISRKMLCLQLYCTPVDFQDVSSCAKSRKATTTSNLWSSIYIPVSLSGVQVSMKKFMLLLTALPTKWRLYCQWYIVL